MLFALADETGSEGQKSPWVGPDYHLHGAIIGGGDAIEEASWAAREFARTFPGVPPHISEIVDHELQLDALRWVISFVSERDIQFRFAAIERAYWPTVVLTELMLGAFGFRGVPIKTIPGPYSELLELCASRLVPRSFVKRFWEIWGKGNPAALTHFLSNVTIREMSSPCGTAMAELLWFGSRCLLEENKSIHRLVNDRVFDRLRMTIEVTAFENLLAGLIAEAEGGPISIGQDSNDKLRRWNKERFRKTERSTCTALWFGEGKGDKPKFFVVDALLWLSSKCFGLEASRSNDRFQAIFEELQMKAGFIRYRGTSRFTAVEALSGRSFSIAKDGTFTRLLEEYHAVGDRFRR